MTVDFIVIGAQKSGSSALHAALRLHPQVHMPRDEVPYFEDPEYLEKGPEVLDRIDSGRVAGQIVGIKRPDYLAQPECPERIARDLPQAKLIACLRDPVERALSAYYYYMLMGVLPVAPPEEGFPAILSGRLDDRYPRAREVVEYGRYGRHLRRYRQYFPSRALKIVFHDDLSQRPEMVITGIQRFLGIDPRPVNLPPAGTKTGINSLSLLAALSRLQPLLYRYATDGRRPVPRIPGVPGVLFRLAVLYERRTGMRRAPLDEQVAGRLAAEYAEDLEVLASLVDEPLPDWPTIQRSRGRSR